MQIFEIPTFSASVTNNGDFYLNFFYSSTDPDSRALSSASHILISALPSAFPRARESGTGTAFPICLSCYMKARSETRITRRSLALNLTSRTMVLGRLLVDRNSQVSGKPCARAHSRTVRTRFCCFFTRSHNKCPCSRCAERSEDIRQGGLQSPLASEASL